MKTSKKPFKDLLGAVITSDEHDYAWSYPHNIQHTHTVQLGDGRIKAGGQDGLNTASKTFGENHLQGERTDTHFQTLHRALQQLRWHQLSNELSSQVPH